MTKYRNVCFTSFLEEVSPTNYNYVIIGKEICPETRKHHLQGYIEFNSAITLKTVQRRIGDPKCHIEKRKGSAAQASEYCKKEGNFTEDGNLSKAGERTDLQIIKQNVLKNVLSIRDMLETDVIVNPQQLRFAENLTKYGRPVLREKPFVKWIYGPTGCGKTRNVIESEPDLFIVEGEFKWYDKYVGQEAVLFDDFRSQIKLTMLLRILDRYPLDLPVKCGFTNWKPTRIYITSAKSPQECYRNCDENINQLLRRIDVIENMEETFDGPEVGGGNTEPLLDQPHTA